MQLQKNTSVPSRTAKNVCNVCCRNKIGGCQ